MKNMTKTVGIRKHKLLIYKIKFQVNQFIFSFTLKSPNYTLTHQGIHRKLYIYHQFTTAYLLPQCHKLTKSDV